MIPRNSNFKHNSELKIHEVDHKTINLICKYSRVIIILLTKSKLQTGEHGGGCGLLDQHQGEDVSQRVIRELGQAAIGSNRQFGGLVDGLHVHVTVYMYGQESGLACYRSFCRESGFVLLRCTCKSIWFLFLESSSDLSNQSPFGAAS